MLLKKAVEKKQEVPETNPYEWPESYYMETDAHQRKALLEAQISSGDAGADNRLRKELWELRYQTQKKGDVKDNFLYWLMELILMCPQTTSRFGKRSLKKRAQTALGAFGLNRADYFGRELLAAELKHLFLTYGMICMEDKTYASVILGFGKMKQSTLENKLSAEFQAVSKKLPEYLEMKEDFVMLREASLAAAEHLGLPMDAE